MKTMKSTMARLFALCLTVAMVLSMATMGAFAAPVASEQTGTITINSAASDNKAKVELYKIIDVNMVNVGTEEKPVFQPQDPVYIWVDAVATWLETNANATYKGYINASNNAITDSFKKATAGQLSNFFHDMKTAMEPKEDEPIDLVLSPATKEPITIEATSQKITEMEMGQYLVIAEKSAYVYSPATVTLAPVWDEGSKAWVLNDAAVTVKGKGGIDKNVEGENGDDSDNSDLGYAVGDTVTYRLDVVIPDYPKDATATSFNVGDKMGIGLTWDKAVTVYWSSDGVTYSGNKVDPTYYDLKPDAVVKVNNKETEVTFQVEFKYKELVAKYADAKYVHVEYNAILNKDAFVEDALGNDAYLGVNTDPYDGGSYETTDTHEQVYTYGIDVTKVDANNHATTLAGAEFTLKGADGKEIQFVKTGEGIYVKYAEKAFEKPVTPVTTLVAAADGTLQLQGVDVGTYTLTETKAPGGYQLPKDKDAVTTIVLTDDKIGTGDGAEDGEDGILDQGTSKVDGTMIVTDATTVNGKVISFKLGNNKPGFELPTTGGMGTVLFTAGGLVIMACGAALVLVTLKKKKAED